MVNVMIWICSPLECNHSKPVTILRLGLGGCRAVPRASARASADGSYLNIAVLQPIGLLLCKDASDRVGDGCRVSRTTLVSVTGDQTLVSCNCDIASDLPELLSCCRLRLGCGEVRRWLQSLRLLRIRCFDLLECWALGCRACKSESCIWVPGKPGTHSQLTGMLQQLMRPRQILEALRVWFERVWEVLKRN